jgi:RNA polymerase sigma-70 factor (ECF subfamily)
MADPSDPEPARGLERALANLPALQGAIFIASARDGLSHAEIARRTGLSVRRVEHHLARAIWKIDRQLSGRRLSLWQRWV